MAAKKPIKKTTSTGSPTLDAANAAKNFKAPKDYKPLTTGQKVAMVASVVGPGKVVKGVKAATTTAKAISKVRAGGVGREGASKVATKIGDKLSGASSKKVQDKLHKIAVKDMDQTAKYNKDLDSLGAYSWSKHPAMVSGKGYNKAVNQGKTVTDRQSVRYRVAEDKAAARANARGLKAANKPTKASKTFEGNNKKISPEVRRGVLKNTPPARPNRERGGSLNTLRKQGKTK